MSALRALCLCFSLPLTGLLGIGCQSGGRAAQSQEEQVTSCEGATRDGEGRCRAASGQFADSSCCAETAGCAFGSHFNIFEVEGYVAGPTKDLPSPAALSALETEQVLRGVQMTAIDGNTLKTIDDAYRVMDENSLVSRHLSADGSDDKPQLAYTAYEYTAGDTPLAFVFRDDTNEIVMLGHDQDVGRCDVPAACAPVSCGPEPYCVNGFRRDNVGCRTCDCAPDL